jgi:hypothetical protein
LAAKSETVMWPSKIKIDLITSSHHPLADSSSESPTVFFSRCQNWPALFIGHNLDLLRPTPKHIVLWTVIKYNIKKTVQSLTGLVNSNWTLSPVEARVCYFRVNKNLVWRALSS